MAKDNITYYKIYIEIIIKVLVNLNKYLMVKIFILDYYIIKLLNEPPNGKKIPWLVKVLWDWWHGVKTAEADKITK